MNKLRKLFQRCPVCKIQTGDIKLYLWIDVACPNGLKLTHCEECKKKLEDYMSRATCKEIEDEQ